MNLAHMYNNAHFADHDAPPRNTLAAALDDILGGSGVTGVIGPYLYSNGGAERFKALVEAGNKGDAYGQHFNGEQKIIGERYVEIARWAAETAPEAVIIVGPGPASSLEKKDWQIVDALIEICPSVKSIKLIELSEQFNSASKAFVEQKVAGKDIAVESIQQDYRYYMPDNDYKNALVISTGATVSNLEKVQPTQFPSQQTRQHLTALRNLARTGGKLILGYDSCLDVEQLKEAYDNKPTAAMMKYPLERAARDGMIINPRQFEYRPEIITNKSMVAHSWVAKKDQDIILTWKGADGREESKEIFVRAGDVFYPYFSIKFKPQELSGLAQKGRQQQLSSKRFYQDQVHGQVIHLFDCV